MACARAWTKELVLVIPCTRDCLYSCHGFDSHGFDSELVLLVGKLAILGACTRSRIFKERNHYRQGSW